MPGLQARGVGVRQARHGDPVPGGHQPLDPARAGDHVGQLLDGLREPRW
ncbi:hypothetical protein ABZW30_30705 [Kitasatospora sp. NPDC004669]